MHIGFTYVYLGFGGLIHIGPLISPLIAFLFFSEYKSCQIIARPVPVQLPID